MTGADAAGVAAGALGDASLAAAARILERGVPGWPASLEHLDEPPARLWLLGGGLPAAGVVAVVGARRASLVGLAAARRLGMQLAEAGIVVVSGMALGIDGAAHAGAMDRGGRTIAVLGCGVDVCYPARHRALRDRIIEDGTIATEELPGSAPLSWRFPRRNRIIAALCVAVVVVEAGERSGALSTARWAADLGRDVLAVPGSVASESCAGSNRLLRDGAAVCLGVDDVFAAVPALVTASSGPAVGALTDRAGGTGRGLAERVVALLAGGPAHPDDLAAELGIGLPRLARHLAAEELAGRLVSVAGGRVAVVPLAAPRATPQRPTGVGSGALGIREGR